MSAWLNQLLGLLPFAALGLALPGEECSECGETIPLVRKPANWRQGLWGGWTCPHCGCEFDRWGRCIGGKAEATASDAVGLTISDEKLRILRPDLYGLPGLGRRIREAVGLAWPQKSYIAGHLRDGDSRAAVVVSVDPLLVAAYTDEMDCVAIVEFPDGFAEDYGLEVGSRLLSVNTYTSGPAYDADLEPGPLDRGQWTGFQPILAEFVSDDLARIEARSAGSPRRNGGGLIAWAGRPWRRGRTSRGTAAPSSPASPRRSPTTIDPPLDQPRRVRRARISTREPPTSIRAADPGSGTALTSVMSPSRTGPPPNGTLAKPRTFVKSVENQ